MTLLRGIGAVLLAVAWVAAVILVGAAMAVRAAVRAVL